jgi:hypothetical protein
MLDGLWHRSGGTWSEVRPEGQEVIGARLVGESAGSAWAARGGDVLAVSPDGSVDIRFRAAAAGLARSRCEQRHRLTRTPVGWIARRLRHV